MFSNMMKKSIEAAKRCHSIELSCVCVCVCMCVCVCVCERECVYVLPPHKALGFPIATRRLEREIYVHDGTLAHTRSDLLFCGVCVSVRVYVCVCVCVRVCVCVSVCVFVRMYCHPIKFSVSQ